MDKFPQELVDAIIDRLRDEREQTLENCSLVCHGFVLRSQTHLFSRIRLRSSSRIHEAFLGSEDRHYHPFRSGSLIALRRTLSHSPHIATFIRQLMITEPNWLSEDYLLQNLNDSAWSSFFPELVNLDSISVSFSPDNTLKDIATSDMMSAIHHAPKLRRIRLAGDTVFEDLEASFMTLRLGECPALRELIFDDIDAARNVSALPVGLILAAGPSGAAPLYPPIRVEHLDINGQTIHALARLSLLDLRSLRSLRLSFGHESSSLQDLSDVFEVMKGTLEHLELSCQVVRE